MKPFQPFRPIYLCSRVLLMGLLTVAACNDNDVTTGITTEQTAQVGEAEYVIDPSQNLIANQVFAPDNPGGTNGILDSLPQPIRDQTQTVLAFAPFSGTFPIHNNLARINFTPSALSNPGQLRVISGRVAVKDVNGTINLPDQGLPQETQDSLYGEFVFDGVRVVGSNPAVFKRIRVRMGTAQGTPFNQGVSYPAGHTQLASAPKGAFNICPTVRFPNRTLKVDIGCPHQIFGGVTMNVVAHGTSLIGTPLFPQTRSVLFAYGPTEVQELDASNNPVGAPSRNNVGHIMLVSHSRNLTAGPKFGIIDQLDVTARAVSELFIVLTPGLPGTQPGATSYPAPSPNDVFGVTGTLYPTGPFLLVQMFAPGADMTPGKVVNGAIRQVRRTGTAAQVGSNPVGSRSQ